MSKEEVKDLYNKGCNEYLRLFCEKHEYDYEDAKDSWVGNSVGGIVCVGDYFVDIATLKADIDMDAPVDEFLKWYDYCTDVAEFGLTTPNYESWLRGCPRTSKEALSNLRSLKKALDTAIAIEKTLRDGGDY